MPITRNKSGKEALTDIYVCVQTFDMCSMQGFSRGMPVTRPMVLTVFIDRELMLMKRLMMTVLIRRKNVIWYFNQPST